MNIPQTKLEVSRKLKNPKNVFRNEDGAIDLASIMVGIIVIGLIGGVIAATVFAVIPWSQDNAAKQQLDSVSSAQKAYFGLSASDLSQLPAGAKANSYADSPLLAQAKLLALGEDYCSVPSSDGSGFSAYSQSTSGKVFSLTDKNSAPALYAGTLGSVCPPSYLSASAPAPTPNTFAKLTLTQQAGSPANAAGVNGNGNYYDTASSADGSIILATSNVGYVYKSTDSGVTWSQITSATLGTAGWQGAAVSADGTRMAVSKWGGGIYVSSDSGNTWTQTATAYGSQNWRDVAMSRDGKHLVIGVDGGAMYYSHDFGATWNTTPNGTTTWRSFAVSDNGQTIVAASATANQLYITKDGGATWGRTAPSSTKNYSGVSVSADGQTILAGEGSGVSVGGLQISNDGGATWQMPGGVNSDYYHGTSMSADGTKMIVVGAQGSTYSDAVYTSVDSGKTWKIQSVGGTKAQWWSVAMSSDGTKVAFSSISGQKIYTGVWN